MFKGTAKNNLFVVVYLVSCTIVIFSITGQIYGVNDDVIIQDWLSGFYTGKPEFMIRGSATPKLLFGFIVSNLYDLVPQVNWFSILLLCLTLTSWFLIGILSARTKNFFVIFSFATIAFLHLIWFIPSPTYTATAVLMSFASITYIAYTIKIQEFQKILIFIFLLYIFSYFVRPESFMLGSAIGGIFLIYSIINTIEKFKNTFRKTSIIIFFCLCIVGIDQVYEKYFYTENKDWAAYERWEAARYAIQANAPEKTLSENPSKYGWTEAEVALFKSYNYLDKNRFSAAKFEKLIKDTEQIQLERDSDFLIKSHQKIFDSDINWEWKMLISLISLIYIVFMLLSFPKVSRYLLLTTISYGTLYAIMLYVAGFLRQPERVQVSVIFLAILISLLSFIFTSEDKAVKFLNPEAIICALLLIIITSYSIGQSRYLVNKIPKLRDSFWNVQIEYLSTFPRNSIFVGNASQFRNNWISPYVANKFEVEKRIFTFGWHNFSPHWVSRAQKLGLNSNNMFESVINDPRVFWVSDKASMDYIVVYMKENGFDFKGPEKIGVMSNYGEDYIVWDFNKND